MTFALVRRVSRRWNSNVSKTFAQRFIKHRRRCNVLRTQWRIQECEKVGGGGGRRCDPTFSSWGFGGRCKPPNGVRGGVPEANAFWQQSIENWLKIRSLGRPRVLNILYCSWDRAHAHATTSRLPPDRENPKAALFCLANRCSRSKMTERWMYSVRQIETLWLAKRASCCWGFRSGSLFYVKLRPILLAHA